MRISDWSSDVCSSDLPADADDRADRAARKNVRRQRVEIGRKGLMRRGREADNQHRGPDIVDILREIDRHDAAGTKEQRDLARKNGSVAGLDESRRQPAAGDAAGVGSTKDEIGSTSSG